MALSDRLEEGRHERQSYELSTQTKDDLQAVHPDYDQYKDEWAFLEACFEGTRAMIEYGVVARHERESYDNYIRRKDEAISLGYTRSVIELFNFYLFKSPIKRQMGPVGETDAWQAFEKDANREGDPLDNYMMEASRFSDVFGHVGILVDKPRGEWQSLADEKAADAYPYFSIYKPYNIMDWEFERSVVTGRRVMKRLKLYDDDGYYRLWYEDHWEVWEMPEDDAETSEPELKWHGPNELEEIPFVWLFCEKSKTRQIGRSDVTDISRIDASIMRNLSDGEEVINYGAFPMMRKPYKQAGETVEGEDDAGVAAVLGFDPDNPDSKPDWLSAEVKDPIDAIMVWVMMKVAEIYRASNAGGMASTEIQTQAKSGVALRAEFQLLNGKLIKKAENIVKALRKALHFWMAWQNLEYDEEIQKIERPKTFEVENLAADLENMLTAKTIVTDSPTFAKAIAKMVARMMLPTADDELLTAIDKEIDEMEMESLMGALDAYLNELSGSEEEEGEETAPPAKSNVTKLPVKGK